MINLSIRFDKNDVRRYTRALKRILRAVDREKKELPYRCAVDYVNLLRQNILTQKFAGSYRPYNEKYADWKAQYFEAQGYLVMRGLMVNALTIFRDRGYKTRWYGGLPPNLPLAPGSSWLYPPGHGKPKSINMYAWLNEFGGTKAKARPVFVPTKQEYEREGIPRRIEESQNIIGRSWQ